MFSSIAALFSGPARYRIQERFDANKNCVICRELLQAPVFAHTQGGELHPECRACAEKIIKSSIAPKCASCRVPLDPNSFIAGRERVWKFLKKAGALAEPAAGIFLMAGVALIAKCVARLLGSGFPGTCARAAEISAETGVGMAMVARMVDTTPVERLTTTLGVVSAAAMAAVAATLPGAIIKDGWLAEKINGAVPTATESDVVGIAGRVMIGMGLGLVVSSRRFVAFFARAEQGFRHIGQARVP